jgi:hypothetical protein
MSLGTLGSTLNDELNRLANGGTYRDMDDMVDEALAAKQWANRENISPYTTDTVGVLNEIAGLGTNRQNWLDFNGVCNYIAGTSGLPAAAALRQIYPTTDLLTGVASYYVDAATPRYNYPGYIRLDGTQTMTTPDAAALDVTGDIDLRARVALTDWTPAAANTLISKYVTTGNQRSYRFTVATDGTLQFTWSTNGTAAAGTVASTVATGITDGATKWVRVAFDVDNGASGNTARFYLSDDGTTWTQLGNAVTTAGTTTIFAGTATLELGASESGSLLTGNYYNAQIFASINDTDKRLDVDLTTNVTSATFNTFTATTGQLVTINGQDVLTNAGTAGSLLPTTVGSSLTADSNDAKFLAHDGTNYVYVPGVASNYLLVPNSSALQITGDIDFRAKVALDDWTPAGLHHLISKWNVDPALSYMFGVGTNGKLQLWWSPNGSAASGLFIESSVATGIADGATKWIRGTLDVNNGASGNTVTFYTSDDGTTWTQLGTPVVTAGVTSIYSNTVGVGIGATNAGTSPSTAKIYQAQIFSDITGTTKVLDVDTSVITTGAATSFTAVTGQTVTINRATSGRKTVAVTQPTWLFGTDDYMEVNNRYMAHSTAAENYVYLSGASGNYMSVADNPPLDITTDLDLQVQVALDDWTPAANSALLYKWDNAGSSAAYGLRVNATTGRLILLWTENGSTVKSAQSTVSPTVTDGSTLWVRATLDVDNGASGNDVKFFTSSDGTTWTQLGTTVTTAGVTSIYSGTGQVEIGGFAGGLSPSKGKFFRAIIKNGIDGTIVLDADASVITLPSQTTFVDRSSNAYTVTINKSGVGTFVSTGNYLYLPGISGNWATAPDSAALDITGDIDIRCKVAFDDWTPAAISGIIAKDDTGETAYYLRLETNGTLTFVWINSAAASLQGTSSVATGVADGATKWVRATLDVDNGASGYDLKFFTSDDGITWTQLGTTVTGGTTTNIRATLGQVNIGNRRTGTDLARGKFFRAQVLNGIGGTLVFDANFENSITSLLQTSFTESSTNGATVTINRSGSTFRSAGVIDAGYLYPGATNTFANSTTDFLNFGATDSLTAIAIVRQWATAPTGTVIAKNTSLGTATVGYALYNTSTLAAFRIVGPSGTTELRTAAISAGTLQSFISARDTAADTISLTYNSTTTSIADPTSSLSNFDEFRIGRLSGSGTSYNDMELVAAAVFRTVLTAAQIRQVTNYFANREVYL